MPTQQNLTTKPSSSIPAITGDIVYDDPFFTMPPLLSPYKVGILSYTASLVSTTVGFPLDSIKTRMQTHSYRNAFDCFKTTINAEGIRGLFRGIAAPLISTSFSRSFGVSIYSSGKPIISSFMNSVFPQMYMKLETLSPNAALDRVLQNIPTALIAGAISGATVSIFACPFELTKIFQQIIVVVNKDSHAHMKADKLPKKLIEVGSNIVKYEGWLGLYSGYKYHFIRDSLSAGLFYSVYETVKLCLQYQNNSNVHLSERVKSTIDALCVPFAGAVAGCFSWITVFPIDTIKAQYQRDVVGNIIRVKSGFEKLSIKPKPWSIPTRDMYRGLGPSITRSMCTTTIFFSGFEYLMKNIA